MTPVGFPHSDIHGSSPAFGFPWLFVDRYVLHRLPVPRHPPCALVSLTCPSAFAEVFQSCSNHSFGFSWRHIHLVVQWIYLSFGQYRAAVARYHPLCFTFFFVSLFSFQGTPAVGNSRSLRRAFRVVCTTLHAAIAHHLFGLAVSCCFCRGHSLFSLYQLQSRFASSAAGGLKWTRTIDLTLIRRAL